jgi:hypothetical protein
MDYVYEALLVNRSLIVTIQYGQPDHPGREIMKNDRPHTYSEFSSMLRELPGE